LEKGRRGGTSGEGLVFVISYWAGARETRGERVEFLSRINDLEKDRREGKIDQGGVAVGSGCMGEKGGGNRRKIWGSTDEPGGERISWWPRSI